MANLRDVPRYSRGPGVLRRIKLEENKNLFLLRFDAGNVLGSVAIAR